MQFCVKSHLSHFRNIPTKCVLRAMSTKQFASCVLDGVDPFSESEPVTI